jgi:hypothetical protein
VVIQLLATWIPELLIALSGALFIRDRSIFF